MVFCPAEVLLFLLLGALSWILFVPWLRKWYSQTARFRRLINKIPGPTSCSPFGNVYRFVTRPQGKLVELLTELVNEYGPIFHIWVGPFIGSVHLTSWKYAEEIFNSNIHIEKTTSYTFLHSWLGTGLLTSTGAKWHSRRKLLTPAFHRSILDSFQEVFVEKSGKLLQILETKGKESKTFDIAPYIWQCSLDIICVTSNKTPCPFTVLVGLRSINDISFISQYHGITVYENRCFNTLSHLNSLSSLWPIIYFKETSMGARMNIQESVSMEDAAYLKSLSYVAETALYRFIRPWIHPKFIFDLTPRGRKFNKSVKLMHTFSNKVIQSRKKEYLQSLCVNSKENDRESEDMGIRKKRKAFIDILIEAAFSDGHEKRPMLSDEDIREEVDTFMFEGHDTTASGISWTLYLLGLHPEIQEEVVAELNEVFGEKPLHSTQKLSELRLLERCIRESLRIYPSVPMIGRKLREDVKLGEYTVPSGTELIIHVYYIQHDKEVFPEPDQFNPDNFLPEACEKRPAYAYVPFSAGSRNCIGQKFAMQEAKTVVASILQKYRIESVQSPEDIVLLPELILRSEKGIQVNLYPRK